MKKSWVDNDAVSPVIATILMVAITVVLAAVLYVMVIGMGTDTGSADLPIGLSQQVKNETSVTVLVASVPDTALIAGSTISMSSEGTPMAVNATVYYANGTLACTFEDNSWDLPNDNIKFTNGMQIRIDAPRIQKGDRIVMTGIGFGTTVMTIN